MAASLPNRAGCLAAAVLLIGLATGTYPPAPVVGPAPAPPVGPYQPAALLPMLGQRAAAYARGSMAVPVPADTSAKGLATVWADLRRRSYFLEADAQALTGRVAGNLRQQLSAHLAPATYTLVAAPLPVRPRPGHLAKPTKAAWQVRLALRGIGRGQRLAFQPAAHPTVAAATDTSVRYQHGAAFAVEYMNTPAGVRQNYYLAQRPGGRSGPVRVALALATGLRPVASPDGQAIDFVPARGGAAVLHYAGLRAWDATGRALPAQLCLSSATTLALEVDDAGASYPLTIDPLASTPTNTLADPNNADYDYFGFSVAGAGDVNGDGYADVLVGGQGTGNGGTGRGSAYLYYGSATGLGTSTGTTAGTYQRFNDPNNADNDNFGYSVAGAGDVNGDGYADLIVGAQGTGNGGTSRGSAYLYLGSATGLGTTLGTSAGQYQRLDDPNNADLDMFGRSVAGAGDVNGDGYADVAIGAYATANGGTQRGSTYVYYGSATSVGTTTGSAAGQVLRLNNPTASDYEQFGNSVAGAGDVNGDGYADVLIGAYRTTNGGLQRGSAYVYLGSATGLGTMAGTSAGQYQRLNDPNNADNDYFGFSVAGAGDVNGDGYADLVVGAYSTANGGTGRGSAYLYLGGLTGVGTSAGTTAGTYQRLNDPNNADGDSFGRSVAGAGDVNGDGYGDVLIGAYQTANGGIQRGSTYLYLGGATGVGTSAGTRAGTYQRLNDPSSADYDYYGNSVAGAGDVNGDGYADVLVGAQGTGNGGISRGNTYLYLGSPGAVLTAPGLSLTDPDSPAFDYYGTSVAGAGDVNGDGYADVVITAPYTANGGISLGSAYVYLGSATGLGTTLGTSAGQYQRLNDPNNNDYDYYGTSAAGAGDVNGDGYADVVVGAQGTGNGGGYRGSIYVYYGSATGVGTTLGTGAGQYQRFNDPVNQDNDSFGSSVAGAGDVNGDGYADLVASAPNTANGGSRRGSTYVYFGSAAGLSATPGTSAGQVLRLNNPANGDYDQFGWSVASAGDVNGDGYADILIGVPYAAGGGSKRGSTYLYLGSATGLSTTLGPNAGQYQVFNDPNGADYDYFGFSAAGAGDVNGDGFSDVVVGAIGTANGGLYRGSTYLYLGSATGLATIPGTGAGQYQRLNDPVNIDYDNFGNSVAAAGDVNGDGYADVLVAAYGTGNGGASRGSTYLYLGSAAGLGTSAGTTGGTSQRLNDPANTDYDNFGNSVAGAGDVNGDGYADLLIGTANGANGGSTYVYRGNQGDARPGRLRLLNTDLATPLAASNRMATQFGLGLTTRSVQGRVLARLVWEVAGNGISFLHTSSLTNSVQYSGRGPWTNLPVAGTELKQLVGKVGRTTRVRVRLEYATASPLAGTSPLRGTGGVGSATRYGSWQYVTAQQLASVGVLPLPVRPAVLAGVAELTLYPNPTTGLATLRGATPGAAVQVVDVLGRVVATATADGEGKTGLALPSGLAPGVYVVRAGNQSGRLVVE